MALMVRRNPWRTMELFNEMANEMLREFPRSENGDGATYRLAVDAYETDDAVVILASVPGVNPEAININLEDDVLTISGEFNHNVENVRYLIRERAAQGQFRRVLRLNVPVVVEGIEATFDNGILTLTLPKAPEARPVTIPVNKKGA
ncbi:MAG: Hsp20/alpha crystallin family protein [Anaerolineae bacterium]|nr:Hsp20/alpha crystallin family protein [Anaerolineae bacterium]